MQKLGVKMNIKFKIVLEKKQYPVIDYRGTLLLFDSGASVPVWCTGIVHNITIPALYSSGTESFPKETCCCT